VSPAETTEIMVTLVRALSGGALVGLFVVFVTLFTK
jgi:hypothetical protein